jgi:HK97 family phage major capsid protein
VNIIRKRTEARDESGKQRDADGGIRFVLSTDAPDLTGDVVVQSGLSLSRDPLPAMIDHGGGLFDLIGQWKDFAFSPHRTTAVLELLERGVSKAADLVRDLYERGVQLAASIGFVPNEGKYELIRDPKNERVIGIRWLEATLTEASVVVTPANPQALALAKSLHPTATGVGRSPNDAGRADILKRLQGTIVPPGNPSLRVITMNIEEQIRAAETALNALRDRAVVATKALGETDDETARQTLLNELETLNTQVTSGAKTLEVLKRTEQTLAARSQPPESAAIIEAVPRVPQEKKARLIVRAGLCTFEAYLRRVPVAQVVEERYGRDPLEVATKAVIAALQVGAMIKAAQNPAMTTVPEWAGALVREGYGAFMEELAVESVVPRLTLVPESFDGFNSITVAARATNPTANPNLAAAFRGEGDPIRVGSVGLTAKKLTPKSMGIIGTFTMELFRRSTPNIENKIHDWMIEDTAIALDGIFLGAGAGTPKQPAGISNNLAAGDTAASSGNTVANITADIRARAASMFGQGLGKRPVWIMNPQRALGLSLAITAAGTLAFPTMSAAGPTLLGAPVVTSITVPPNTVYLIDAGWITFAGGAPEFLGTEVATIHEEYDQAAVAPIGSAGVPAVVAAPVRSLYQTFSAALRALWEVDWLVLRPGAVQTITGVNW